MNKVGVSWTPRFSRAVGIEPMPSQPHVMNLPFILSLVLTL